MRIRFIIAVSTTALTALAAAISPVADAARAGDIAVVRSLVERKADVNAPQADGATAIQWAAYRDDLDMANLLINAGANVKTRSREGATALYLASINGSAAMIERLIEAGADPNELGPRGETPIMLTARNGNVAAMKVLLDHRADIHAKDKLRGTTALMWAAEQSHPNAMKLLIDHGADVKAASNPDTRNGRNNLANPLAQRLNGSLGRGRGGAQRAAQETPPADGAAGARAGTRQASAGGQGGRAGRGGGGASATSNTEVIDDLADLAAQFGVSTNDLAAAAGVDVSTLSEQAAAFGFGRSDNVTDGGGLTPLIFAARQNCLDCAEVLLQAGADVDQVTRYGWAPLLTATQNRHYKMAALLLEHGANPNLANNGGWTALYLATDNRNIENGDYPVRTPDMDHLELIRLLLDKGANVNARICGTKSTPAQCVGDSTETRTNFTMQWLFEDGATPFLRAAQSGDVTLMKLLLAHGANPKIFTAHGVTPLAVAVGIGWVEGVTFEWSEAENAEAIKMCLDLGIDPNVADDEGRTALHGAAHRGRPAPIRLLVEHGAKLDAHDLGSRDSINGGMLGATWIPLDWARGLVRVGVQSAIAHPEAEALLVQLMTEKGLPIPAPPKTSICLTKGVKGCQ
jgi:ankyrin repeat protein